MARERVEPRLTGKSTHAIALASFLLPSLLALPHAANASFNVGPRSVAQSFVITETSCLVRITPSGEGGDDRKIALSFDVGVMKNVSERSGIGLTPFFTAGTTGADHLYLNGGIRGRYRRWLTSRASFELAPGIVLGEARPGKALPPGYSLQASLSPTRTLTFTAELFHLRREEERYHWSTNTHSTVTLSETDLLLGVKFGRLPGLLGGLVAGYAALVSAIGVSEGEDTIQVP